MTLSFKVTTWPDIISMSLQLGKMVVADRFKPDYLVGVARGGLVPLRILSDFFNMNNILIINVKLYKTIGERKRTVEFVQKINFDINASNVLLVDDVADTGITLKAIVEYLLNEKKPKELKVATLHYKPWSVIKPDYYVEETKDWIVYPWEYYESIEAIRKKLSENTLSEEEKMKAKEALNAIQNELRKYNGV